jgi:hypothetical protein
MAGRSFNAARRAALGRCCHRLKHAATRLPPASTRHDRRRPTPRFRTTGAGRLKHASAVALPARRYCTANDSNSSKVHRRVGKLTTLLIKPVISTLLRCTSAELFFSCCDSVAALTALAKCDGHVAKQVFRDRARPHLARFLRRPQLGRLEG